MLTKDHNVKDGDTVSCHYHTMMNIVQHICNIHSRFTTSLDVALNILLEIKQSKTVIKTVCRHSYMYLQGEK